MRVPVTIIPSPRSRQRDTMFLGLGGTGPGRLAFWRALLRPLAPSQTRPLPSPPGAVQERRVFVQTPGSPSPMSGPAWGGGVTGSVGSRPVLVGHMVLVQCSTRARPLAWELAVDRQSNRG